MLDTAAQKEIALGIVLMMGVSLGGPEESRANAIKLLRGACLPERASIAQLARVTVKWLQDHPEKLHEAAGGLIYTALHDAFPCPAPDPVKHDVKPPSSPDKK
jgi:hypothetical protein